MKHLSLTLSFTLGFFACVLLINSYSCTHEDAVLGTIAPPDYEYGDETVKLSEGWNFDKSHSNVTWESPYRGAGSTLTGRFNTFSATIDFEENHPERNSLSGFVVLSTVNTGEPGRDAGCLLNTFGTTTISDTARITSKSFAFDGKGGYDVVADLDFHGVKKEVTMKLNYTGATHVEGNSPYTLVGFSGQFEFNAISDFGIVSANIADRVVVKINTQFKKPD